MEQNTQDLPEEVLIENKIKEKIEAIKNKAKILEEALNVGPIDYHTFIEVDKENKKTGNVFGAFTKIPHMLVQAQAMDCLMNRQAYEAGQILWKSSVLDASDKEVKDDGKYKLGLMGRLGMLLDIQAPDVKKS